MLVSYNWLKEYVDIPWSPEELADRLTMAGLEVEGVTSLNPGLDNVVVGRVLEVVLHPNADKLNVCQVDVGEGQPRQIVCGAPNVSQGQTVAVALPGAVLPGGFEIGSREVRGVSSAGMICSEAELGIGTDHDGIMVLPDTLQVGEALADALYLNDTVLDISIYANRPDCMSVIGIAREVAALAGGQIRYPALEYEAIEESLTDHTDVEVLKPELCPRYTALMIKDIRLGESPLWMQARLRAAGMRPINNVVDITNYVMLEMGQPLHAFDYTRLAGGRIVVRTAQAGEILVTLDGEERVLSEDMLMICDAEKPVCVAGVMGGENSEVTDSTNTIVLESANFNAVSVRRTSKALGISSESAARFEKGIDPSGTLMAAKRAAYLLAEYASGKVLSGIIDRDTVDHAPRTVAYHPVKACELLGTDIPEEDMERTLVSLEFAIEKQDAVWQVTIPPHRRDIELEADLVEEVARIWGYDRIPTTTPYGTTMVGGQSRMMQLEDDLRAQLVGFGLQEALTYSFIPGDSNERLLAEENVEMLRIANPISEDLAYMRTSLLPGLLMAVSTNAARQQSRAALFEVGAVYLAGQVDPPTQPKEARHLGIVLYGDRSERNWAVPHAEFDFFDIKGILEAVLPTSGLEWTKGANPTFHPFRQGRITLGGKPLAVFGEIHPTVARNFRIGGSRVYAAEVDLEVLLAHQKQQIRYKEISRFPRVDRDLAVLIGREQPVAQLVELITKAGGDLLQDVRVFDVYQGKPVPEDKKSVAFSLQFQGQRTLQEKEINDIMEQIITRLKEAVGAEIR